MKIPMKIPKQAVGMKVQVYHDTDKTRGDEGMSFVQCAQCLHELQELEPLISDQARPSPKQYARQQVSLTRDGVQVWCTRHEMNITTMALRAVRVRK